MKGQTLRAKPPAACVLQAFDKIFAAGDHGSPFRNYSRCSVRLVPHHRGRSGSQRPYPNTGDRVGEGARLVYAVSGSEVG